MAKKNRKARSRRDIYQEVTGKIVEYLEQGTAPWRNPIKQASGDGWPTNLDSGKRYRGINVFLLGLRAWESGFESNYWATFKQAQARGGQVRKGEKGTLVTFWKLYATQDKSTGEPVEVPVLRHYTAFNLQQIDGIEAPDKQTDDQSTVPFEPLAAAECIIDGYEGQPTIQYDGGHRAFYRPRTDSVHLPQPDQFDSREQLYCTAFHELAHSTGHSKRLDRGLDTQLPAFGSPDYTREELVAEMSSAFLCAAAGISPPTIEQSAAYLNGWIKTLKGDKRLVVSAAGAAQKAADHILGTSFSPITDPGAAEAVETETVRKTQSAGSRANGPSNTQLDLF